MGEALASRACLAQDNSDSRMERGCTSGQPRPSTQPQTLASRLQDAAKQVWSAGAGAQPQARDSLLCREGGSVLAPKVELSGGLPVGGTGLPHTRATYTAEAGHWAHPASSAHLAPQGAGFRIPLGVGAPPACLRSAWTLMDAEAPWPQPSHTWTLYWPEHGLRIGTRPRAGAWGSGGTFPAGTNKEHVLVDSKCHLQKEGSEIDKTQVKFNQEMQPHVPHEGCSPEPDSKCGGGDGGLRKVQPLLVSPICP